jgi:Ca2+-binding RTX toxin-like protein
MMAIITGTTGDDKEPFELEGTNLADEIYGLAGNDTLVGMDGDDILEGGTGADELFGSGGMDVASYRGSSAGVSVVLYSSGSGGDAAGDRYFSIEGAIGSAFSDTLIGDEARNIFYGEGGNDGLSSFGGNDILYGGGGKDVLNGGLGSDELRGGDGTDTASFFMYGGVGVVADLASGTATGHGNDRLFSIENLQGTLYNDRLAGNAGANSLDGGSGADVLVGRGGADRFVFHQAEESLPVAPDRILDFSRSQGDRIDLRNIDANVQVDGDQAFDLIGSRAFQSAGQLRFFQQNGDTIVEANTDDSLPGAELRIVLDPLVSLQQTDFVL